MVRLHDLQEIMIQENFLNKLHLILLFQLGWFVNVLWKVYDGCHTFFSRKVSQKELMEGAILQKPFQNLNNIISEFGQIK